MSNPTSENEVGIDRRGLVATVVAAGVAASVTSGPAGAQTAGPATSSVDISKLPKSRSATDLKGVMRESDILLSKDLRESGFESAVSVVDPIDIGADTLLAPFQNAQLIYSPLDVEYLLQTLNDHIRNCMELRQKGQELEIATVSNALISLYEQEVIDTAIVESEVLANNRNRILGETLNARYSDSSGTVTGAASTDPYFRQRAATHSAYITAKQNDLNRRKEFSAQDGGASNFAQRFALVRTLFQIELKEAYQRARAVSAGLLHVYELTKPVPAPTRSGYLDVLIRWTREAVYELERKLLARTESVITLALAPAANARHPALMTAAEFASARTAGLFRFTLSEAILSARPYVLTKPRLRGVEIGFWGTYRSNLDQWNPNAVEVKAPEQRVRDVNGLVVHQSTPRALVSPVEFLLRREYKPTRINALHNASLNGQWEVETGLFSILGTDLRADTYLQNLLLILTVTHER